MPWNILLTSVLIFVARIGDTTFATLRTVAIVQGHRWLAWVLGCFESLIWVFAAARVLGEIGQNPVYAVAFAVGYATGGYVGITVDRWLAFGRQAIRVFTRTPLLEYGLRTAGYPVTRFDGQGRDGPVIELFIAVPRRQVGEVLRTAQSLDNECFYTVEDIRRIGPGALAPRTAGPWLSQNQR